MGQLAGQTVKLFGDNKELFAWPILMLGIGPDGKPAVVQVAPGGATVLVFPSGTPDCTPIADSSNADVPIGAKNWSFAILTGTGTVTINSKSFVVSAGYSQSSLTTLAGRVINVATDAASTAVIYFET